MRLRAALPRAAGVSRFPRAGMARHQPGYDSAHREAAMTDEQNNIQPSADEPTAASTEDAADGNGPSWLVPHRWKPGQSGNPSGRPRESGSLAAALRRVGVKPAKTRAELSKLASQLGMNPDEAQNIDVIAGLVYDGITQLLIRTVKGSAAAGDKLVGLLQILSKALDGDERRITLSGPGDLQAALTSVSAVLGFKPGTIPQPDLRPPPPEPPPTEA